MENLVNAALIIIDQQQGLDHPKLGQINNPSAESVMLKLLSLWRSSHRPIIHIKHHSIEPDSVFWAVQEPQAGWALTFLWLKMHVLHLPNKITLEK